MHAGAPALLTSAQGLVAAKDTAIKAAAEKLAAAQAAAEEAMKADWTLLASAVPSAITAVDSRVSMLAKSKKLPAGVTKDALTAAQNSLASAKTLWGEAASAQTAGKLGDAVAAAKQAKDSIDAALAGLGMSAG